MNRAPTADIEARLRRIERRGRLQALVLLLAAVALLTAAARGPRTLRAESFELVTPEGHVAATLELRDGAPGFYLMDENGTQRVALFHEPQTSGLYVSDTEGVTRIGIAQFAHGGGGVALHGAQSRGAAVLYLKDEGSLRFYDADGNMTRSIRAGAE